MRKALLLTALLTTLHLLTVAQPGTIQGTITDTTSNEKLQNTVIALLNAKDSMLYRFTRSDANGLFQLTHLKGGEYIVLVTYPGYADYVDRLRLQDSGSVRLNIPMTLKANLLKDVIVRQTISAIKMKGDTTEYAADSFKVQPNATVEDLLKKLPGIQVDKNGQITAQGEKVQKVLVDGEEFFGDDPTLVTQNLRADMVEKVQVYDKKSDQATFTGIDDGEKQKTINLKLKDDKKNGYFGRINIGGGTDGYHDNQAMVNIFRKKQKFAAYGIVSNTGKTGLNWQDRSNYGDSWTNNLDYDENSGYYFTVGSDDELDSWNGQYNGQGYPLVQTGGLHYNNKWDDDKQSINGNYKILQLHVNGNSFTSSQYILPDTLYYNSQTQSFANKILRNRLNGTYEFQFDSTSSVKVYADGGNDHKITNSIFNTESRAIDSSLVNTGRRSIATIGDKRDLNSNILWRKKLKKKGRTISLNVRETYSDNSSDGYLYSDNDFYINGNITGSQITDQYKVNKGESTLFDTKITYTEPLSKISSLIFNYGIVTSNSNSERNSYNKSNDGKYTVLDSLYSNDYAFNLFTHRAGMSYSLFQKKLKLNLGSNIGLTSYDQKDMHSDSSFTRKFVNWYPQANVSYQFTQQRRFMLHYNGNTQQPTIQQIQPVRTNDDPLNVSLGNPDLKPAFQNSIWLNFFDYKVLTNRFFQLGLDYNFTANAISSKDYIDSIGRRVYQSVNVNGTHSLGLYFYNGYKLKKSAINLGINGNINSSRYVNIVNNMLNVTNSGNYTLGVNIGKDKEKKYSFYLNGSATFTSSKSSIQENVTTRYWQFNAGPGFDIYFAKKLQLHSDADLNFRQKTSVFDNNTNVVLWNAWLGKKFMKNDVLLLKISVNDILDENIGFNRTVNSNYISQNTYSTIRRYFLVSAVWNFNKAGIKVPGQGDQ